jgi:hypothetical protein
MNWIKTKEQARQRAIKHQKWASERNLSYAQVLFFQDKLVKLGRKFGLIREFKENGLI